MSAPIITVRRIAAPDFRILPAAPAGCRSEAYCKDITTPNPAIPGNKGPLRYFQLAWGCRYASASGCAAKRAGRPAPPSRQVPGQYRFHPPAETAPAPIVHRAEGQRGISAGISPANRGIQEWRRKTDTNGWEFRPA